MKSASDIVTGAGSYTAPGVRMSRKELNTVSGAILTDHPEARRGELIPYEYDRYFYIVEVLELPGDYYFTNKIALVPKNQARIRLIRKGMKKDE